MRIVFYFQTRVLSTDLDLVARVRFVCCIFAEYTPAIGETGMKQRGSRTGLGLGCPDVVSRDMQV